MKRTYEKPEIIFEDFSLSTNIAGDCTDIIGNQSENTCPILTESGHALFVSAVDVCTTKVPDGYNTYCYHAPTDDSDLFNS